MPGSAPRPARTPASGAARRQRSSAPRPRSRAKRSWGDAWSRPIPWPTMRCEREGDRPPHFGREDLVRRHAREEADADEPRQQSDSHLPRESGLSSRDHRIEEGGPERARGDVDAREPRRHRLLGPHDDRVAADEQEGADDAEGLPFAPCAGELPPVARTAAPSSSPAARNRAPAKRNGGRSCTPIRMAR